MDTVSNASEATVIE